MVKQDELDAKIIQKKKETDEKQLALDQAKYSAQVDIANNYVNAVGSLTELVTTIRTAAAGKDTKAQEKAAKDQFNILKGVQIAATIISGINGVVNALSAKSTLPEPFATALRVSNAVAIGVASAAAIAKIAATKYNSTSGGGAAPSTPSAPSPSVPQQSTSAPSTMGLGEMKVLPQKEQYNWQKVYVTQGDIRETINRVEVIETRSKLGT